MEQSRLFIAIALSFLVFFVWQFLFVEKEPAKQPGQQTKEKKMVSEAPYIPEKEQAPVQAPITATDS